MRMASPGFNDPMFLPYLIISNFTFTTLPWTVALTSGSFMLEGAHEDFDLAILPGNQTSPHSTAIE